MAERKRVEDLIRRFRQRYGFHPTILARAPGRVNLIGEHTDYNGLPVLPMAIDRSVLVAGAPREDRWVEIGNVDARFPARRYLLEATIPPFADGDWGNYHKAAAQGLLSLLGPSALHGGEFLVDGNIPAAAGLSSSSALLVGSALALLAVNECNVPVRPLAELLASAERYVGTLSGGMDQAVCLLAEPGTALRIDFDPLRTRSVRIPPGYAFVVCHSLVAAEKSGAARAAYNQRVIECRLACVAFEHALGVGLSRPLAHLGDLTRRFPDRAPAELIRLLLGSVREGALGIDELARTLSTTPSALRQRVGLGAGETRYRIVARARHVLTEAERVQQAAAALENADWPTFGALLNASHASCRDDYDISCASLEALVAAAKAAGALAARLTGAGFGGCTVNLVAEADVPRFLAMIDWQYYQSRAAVTGFEHCFVFTPSQGATVLQL